jgi:hypothetical protein
MPSPRGLRARRAAESLSLPEVEPIVPIERPTAFNDPAWLFEPKYDGYRGLLYVTQKAVPVTPSGTGLPAPIRLARVSSSTSRRTGITSPMRVTSRALPLGRGVAMVWTSSHARRSRVPGY